MVTKKIDPKYYFISPLIQYFLISTDSPEIEKNTWKMLNIHLGFTM